MSKEEERACSVCGTPVFVKHWLTWMTPMCDDCREKDKNAPKPVAKITNKTNE